MANKIKLSQTTGIASEADLDTAEASLSSLSTTVAGKVTGIASSTDTTIPLFDGTTGKLLKASPWTVSSTGILTLDGTYGQAIRIVTNKGTGAGADNLLYLEATNSAWDRPILRINNAGTAGGATHIRLDGVSPQIEWVEDDQVSPAGKFETQVQGNIFYINSRNSADDSFENCVWFLQANTVTGMNGHIGIGVNPFGIEKLTIGDTTGGAPRIALKKTTAPTLDTNYGKFWVSSTDGLPKFMDDAGVEYTLTRSNYQVPYIGEASSAPNSAANVGTANRAWFKAVEVRTTDEVTGIRLGVAVSSGNIDVGLYDSSLVRIASSGSVACPATNTKSTVAFTAPVTVNPGIYYLAITADNTTATFSRSGTDSIMGLGYQDTSFPLPSSATLSYLAIGSTDRSFAILGTVTGGLTS